MHGRGLAGLARLSDRVGALPARLLALHVLEEVELLSLEEAALSLRFGGLAGRGLRGDARELPQRAAFHGEREHVVSATEEDRGAVGPEDRLALGVLRVREAPRARRAPVDEVQVALDRDDASAPVR